MSTTSYQILIALEDIFKADSRTDSYTIQSAEDPDFPPGHEACPAVNIFPADKERELVRMSATPYVVMPSFDVVMWEVSLEDFSAAFKLIDAVEENVFETLAANKTIDSNVLTSTIGATVYEHIYYEETFYIKAVMSLETELNR